MNLHQFYEVDVYYPELECFGMSDRGVMRPNNTLPEMNLKFPMMYVGHKNGKFAFKQFPQDIVTGVVYQDLPPTSRLVELFDVGGPIWPEFDCFLGPRPAKFGEVLA